MWFHIKITIYILLITLLPYLLAGGILKFIIPKVKSNLVAILATLLIAYLDQEYHFFGNIVKLSSALNSSIDSFAELPKAGFPFYGKFIMASISTLLGRMIIPFCFARLGVMIVDKIKKKKNPQQDDASNSDSATAKLE